MANIKQQKKRVITNNKRNELNSSFDSSLKTAMKSFESAVASGNKQEATEKFNFLCKKLDKSVVKGVYSKNHVSREKSRCAKMLNKLA